MQQFTFKAHDKEDNVRTGTLFAKDRDAAIRMISERELTIIDLSISPGQRKRLSSLLNLGVAGVKGEELLTFTQELGAMLNAGITLRNAMDVLVEDIESPVLGQIVAEIDEGLNAGGNLSDLLKGYPQVFNKLYVSMAAAGESSGSLPQVLLRLAGYIEKSENLKKKVQAALYYPAMVISFAVVIVTLILTFGIPKFAEFYAGMGIELPLATRTFVGFGNFVAGNWYILLPLLLATAYMGVKILRTDKGQLAFDHFKLTAPIFGPLLRRLSISRFARTLSSLYASGVPILHAMEVVSGSTGNRVMENVVLDALRNLKEGESITAPLRRSKVFTPMAISMIAAGEESGSLHTMLSKLADFYETQVDLSLQSLSGLLEPLVLITIGVFIGVVIVVLGLPILQLGSILH